MIEFERAFYFEYPYRIISEKIVRALDNVQLMGDPFDSRKRANQVRRIMVARPQPASANRQSTIDRENMK